jgi:hypothetical protein
MDDLLVGGKANRPKTAYRTTCGALFRRYCQPLFICMGLAEQTRAFMPSDRSRM